MECYPIHPSNYGVTVDSGGLPGAGQNSYRKRQRDEESEESGGNSGHEAAGRTSSVSVEPSASARRGNRESGQVNQTRETRAILSSSSNAAPSSSSTTAPAPSATESTEAKRLERLAAQKQRREEKWKRLLRESIAQTVGHEVDSDEERRYWEASAARDRAEEARRRALSPEARRQEDVDFSTTLLRDHIKPRLAFDTSGLPHLDRYPLFVLQTAPESRRGAGCKLHGCTARIVPGQCRIALSPGEAHWAGPDYYHVKCFEELLDLSSPHYVARFVPDRKYTPNYGAQCILQEYISRWKLRIQKSKEAQRALDQGHNTKDNATAGPSVAPDLGVEGEPSTTQISTQQTPAPATPVESAMQEQASASSNLNRTDLDARPGVATEPSPDSPKHAALDVWKIGDGLWEHALKRAVEASRDHAHMLDILDDAENEDDVANAPADQDRSWRITQYLLPEDDPDYDKRHALSQALAAWRYDTILASASIEELSQKFSLENGAELVEGMRQRKAELGDLSLRRIERYNVIRMPDYQSAFLRGL